MEETLPSWILNLPLVNACLNGLALLFLCLGFYFIKQKKINSHRAMMGSAFLCSILFLISYLVYHAKFGSKKYAGEWRTLYFSILFTHTVLAAAVPFLSVTTLYKAIQNNIPTHKTWAKITFPIWVYVSFTGIVIYWMLYATN